MNRYHLLRSFAAFCLVFVPAAFFWWSSRTNAERQLDLAAELTAQYAASKIQLWLADRAGVSSHIASNLASSPRFDPEEFRDSARRVLPLIDGFQAINWIDPEGIIRIVMPLAGNEPAMGYDLLAHPREDVREALRKAIAEGISTRPLGGLELIQGGSGFAIYTPARNSNGETLGIVNSVFRLDALRAACFGEIDSEDFRFAVAEANGDIILSHDMHNVERSTAHLWTQSIQIVDREWTILVAPSERLTSEYRAIANPLVLVFGILGGLGLAGVQLQLDRRDRDLLVSRHRFLDLFEHGPVAMINWRPEPNPDDIVIDEANIAASQLSGYPREELTFPLSRLFDHDRRGWDRISAVLAESMAEAGNIHIPGLTLTTRSGELRQVEMTIRFVPDKSGGVSEARAVVLDVTDQLRMELQLRHTQKMEAIGQLAGGVAHDFNNLIQSISMAAAILREDLSERADAVALLDEIVGATDRAAGLVRQLLAFGRKDDPHFEVTAVGTVVTDSAQLVRRLIGENISLELQLDPDVPAINADRNQLDQVILNLCLNARDAMPNSGSIVLTVTKVAFDEAFCAGNAWARPGEFIRLGVADTGSGMEEELLDRIFEPFFTTKPVDQGTGLGLATVYGIAQGHGGFVHVTSRLGEGSTFEVYFPTVAGSVRQKADRDVSPVTVPPAGQIEILIVEDDELVRNFVARVLNRAGYLTRTAGDGAEALEMLAGDWSPRLIVADAIMPRMNGFEMYKILRSRGSDIPIIFSSGYSADNFSAEVRSDPRVALVPKPYTREAMLSAIADLLSLHEN